MDYTGIDGIKIGGEGSAPVDGSNFVAGVAAAEGVAGVAIAIPITNYCAKTVTVNNGSTLYNYVDGARIVVKPAATVYNYAANSAASVKIIGSNGRDDIHNSGANSTIEAGAGSDEIRIGVPSADKTVVVADLTSGDTLFIEDFSLKYYSRSYDAAGNLVLETKQQKKLTIKGIGRLDETSTAETRWYENEGTLYYGNGSVSYTSRRRGNGLEITRTLNTGTENILQISGATGTPQIENDYLLKFTPENFLGGAEVLKNSKGYRYKFESGDYGGKTVTLPAPTAVFSSASNINLDMSKGAGCANREIYISGGDNVTVSGMNDGFIKIAQNVQKMTLTVTGMNADWSDIRFEGGITSYAQTMDGVLVNGNILIKGTNLQQDNGWKIDSEHSASLSSGTSSGLVFIDKYHGHEANGYDRLKYKSGTDNAAKAIVRGISRAPSVKGGTITIEDDIFIDSDTAVTVSSANHVFAVNSNRKKVAAETAATLDVKYSYNTITGSAYADSITNTGSSVRISLGADNDNIWNYDNENVAIFGGESADNVLNYNSKKVYIDGGAGDDELWSRSENSTIIGGNGNDKIDNLGSNSKVFGGAGNDSIINTAQFVTIDAGSGYDTVENFAENVVINLGSDFSSIYNEASNVTINFGTSWVTNISEDGHAYKYYSNKNSNVMLVGSNHNETLGNQADHSTINGGVDTSAIQNLNYYGATEITGATRLYKLTAPNHFNFSSTAKIFGSDIYGNGLISFELTADELTNAEFKLNSVKFGETELTASGGIYSVELRGDGTLTAESFIQISGAYRNEIANVSVAGTAAAPIRLRLT